MRSVNFELTVFKAFLFFYFLPKENISKIMKNAYYFIWKAFQP